MTVPTDPPARRRPVLRPVEVVRIEDPGPRLRRVTFGGSNLQGFGPARPGAHIKLFFAEMPADWRPEPGQPRPPARTYTPRSFDAARNELVVEFVRHGAGMASDWAENAQLGDRITVAGPGGGHDFEPGLRRLVILADESALPAAGMIIDAVPADCHVTLVAEVVDAADQILPSQRLVDSMHWLHRLPTNAQPGSLLLDAARSIQIDDSAQWWVACEAVAMRAIKAHLTGERGLDRNRLISRGYWKQGATDHPDHDTGE
ncbi:siderophore-interacting protein [Dokdonella sp.]|uniref:siderophore-interacting protein n=1 Tax=Dokdonella sp. TaxID=2291710 RepID=UPI003C5B88C3